MNKEANKDIFDKIDTFIPVPNSILRSKRFTPCDVIIFGAIYGLSRKTGYCYASKYTLSDETGFSYNKIVKSVGVLIKSKLISDVTPEEYNSKTQVRWYSINLEVLKTYVEGFPKIINDGVIHKKKFNKKDVDKTTTDQSDVVPPFMGDTTDLCEVELLISDGDTTDQSDVALHHSVGDTTSLCGGKDIINRLNNIKDNILIKDIIKILIKGDRDVEEFLNKIPDRVISLESLAKQFIESPYDEMFELVRKSNEHLDFFKKFAYNLPDDVERKDDIINRYTSIESNFENELPF